MKLRSFILFLFMCFVMYGQTPNSEEKIEELKGKVAQSIAAEKLKWLDSLSQIIVTQTKYSSDSIVRETVNYALSLDSMRVATWQTANLIYYQNNRTGDALKGNQIFVSFLETASKTKDDYALAKFYLEGADSFYFIENYEKSIHYYELAEDHARKARSKRLEGLAKLYRGSTMSFQGKFSEASQVLQEASRIFQNTNDTFNIISAKNSLSILYSQNAFFDEAAKERNEAIAIALDIESYEHLTSFYFNAATDARKQGLTALQIENFKKAIHANQNTGSPDVYISMIYSGLITSYANQDSIAQARMWIEKLEMNPEKFTQGLNRDSYLWGLKNLSFATGNFLKAANEGEEHLAILKRGSHYEEIQIAEEFLAKVYDTLGNMERAYQHFKAFTSIKDSINSVQKIKALSYYQTLYETEKRDATIVTQNKDIALLDAKSKILNQRMLFGAFAFLVTFGIILGVRARNTAKKRQKMQDGFAQNLIQAQENERTRLARELHDSVGQKLMLLTRQTKQKGDVNMEQLAGNTLDELRSISRNLHPATLEKLGISKAIEALVNEVDAYSPIFFTNEIENIDALIANEDELHIYRIIQEVLSNMVKHSEAKSASVVLEKKKGVIKAVIRDNGKGFNFSEKKYENDSLGMKTLLERAKIIGSKLEIESEHNKGTVVTLQIPF